MIQIVIPAAGRGSRFNNSIYQEPKPLIVWEGKNMIEHVINNFINENNRIFVVMRDHHQIDIADVYLKKIDYYTDGPACTAKLVKEDLDLDDELIITNCDQIIKDWNEEMFLSFSRNYDAVLGCFISNSPKNSYVRLNDENLVTEVREKKVISNLATNGLHYWKKARYFFDSLEQMIENNDRTNNEFFVAPTYNYLINEGYKVGIYLFNQHFPIGTPDDLTKYLQNGITQN